MDKRDMFKKKVKPSPKPPKVVVNLQFEMNEKTAKLFLQSSIERVINCSVSIVEDLVDNDNYEDASVNVEDWAEWKPVVCSLWSAVHDAVFRSQAGLPASDRIFELRKGEL